MVKKSEMKEKLFKENPPNLSCTLRYKQPTTSFGSPFSAAEHLRGLSYDIVALD